MKPELDVLKVQIADIFTEINELISSTDKSSTVITESLMLGQLTDKVEAIVYKLKKLDKDNELFDQMVDLTNLLLEAHAKITSRLQVLEEEAFEHIQLQIETIPGFKMSDDEKALHEEMIMLSQPQPLKVSVVALHRPLDPKSFFGAN